MRLDLMLKGVLISFQMNRNMSENEPLIYLPSSTFQSGSSNMKTEPINEIKPGIKRGGRKLSNEGPNTEKDEKLPKNEPL